MMRSSTLLNHGPQQKTLVHGNAASCNLKYRSAPEWTSTECLLNTTVWGRSSQVTWGASDDLPRLHQAVYNVVSRPAA